MFGFEEAFCLSCINKKASDGTVKQSIQFDDIKVSQTSKCATMLSETDSVYQKTFEYDGVTKLDEIKEIFTNSDKANCPLTKCTLTQEGCKLALSSTNISLTTSSSQTITVKKDIIPGYEETVCLTCENGYQTITKDSLVVK